MARAGRSTENEKIMAMEHVKIHVDNPSCMRRFHITFDKKAAAVEESSVSCLHCGQRVFGVENHPPISLARDENLIEYRQLGDRRVYKCKLESVSEDANASH